MADRGIRSTFATGSRERIEVHNEYLDVSRFPRADYQQDLANFLRRKYAGRKVDLVMAGLASALDFTLKFRDQIFPNVPVVFFAVDRNEIAIRDLAADVIGVPMEMDLNSTLELALRLHPQARHVYVVVGKSRFDSFWETKSRQAFRNHSETVSLTYLVGLPVAELLKTLEHLPDQSIIYYLHVFRRPGRENLHAGGGRRKDLQDGECPGL
jgi:hypothetical protein